MLVCGVSWLVYLETCVESFSLSSIQVWYNRFDTWPWVSTILTIDMLISKGLNIFITHYPVWHVDFAWQGASVLKYEWICL